MDMPVQIKLTLEPAEANAASLEWKSDNPEIAEVVIEDGKAFVNAKKEGGCKISVSPYGRSDESKEIAVTVYPAAFKLMRRTISGESGYVEITNEDSFDITDIGMPYKGIRYIEMIRVDGGELLDSSVEVYNENPGIVSITKRKRSEVKILLEAEEKSEVGATKVSVSLKEDDNVYTKTFTITRQKHDFTSDTKICRINTETPVNDVEEMARNATMEVQMFPAVNAVWTSSNESVAKVVPATSDGKGFSPMAEIRTFGEYGSAEITATDESGEHTRKFTVKVSKASFPAGTKIGTRVGGKLVPVGESTTLRASYDGRNDAGFGLMDASGYIYDFRNKNAFDSSMVFGFNGLIELMFTADHGSARNYRKLESGECECVLEPDMGEYSEFVRKAQEGALKFVALMKESKYAAKFSGRHAYKLLRSLLTSPTYEESVILGDLKFYDMYFEKINQFCGWKAFLMNPKKSLSAFLKSNWKIGYLRKMGFRNPATIYKLINKIKK